jgi:predicted transcriptional regulator
MVEIDISDKEIKVLTSILSDSGYITGEHLSKKALSEIPEFLIFYYIYTTPSQSISSEELENKMSVSLAMLLSNLAADSLIIQSSNDYRWKFSENIAMKINVSKDKLPHVEKNKENEVIEPINISQKVHYLTVALENSGYLEDGRLSKSNSEAEILLLLNEFNQLSTDALEEKVGNKSSISLSLSNLQADRLITQVDNYDWRLSNDLLAKIDALFKADQPIIERKLSEDVEESETSNSNVIYKNSKEYEHLFNALSDSPYMKNLDNKTNILDIPVLEILMIIYKNEKVDEQKLEDLSINSSISLSLSNLQADGLIEQIDNEWCLSLNLRKIIDESMKSSLPEKVSREEESSPKLKISDQIYYIVHALNEMKLQYVSPETPEKNYLDIAEVEILNILIKHVKLSTDKFEELITKNISVSLTLSNLQADGIIKQNDEYEWELDEKFTNLLKSAKTKDIKPKVEETIVKEERIAPSLDELNIKEKMSEQVKLKRVLLDLGLIKDENLTIKELLQRADFEILWLILHHQAIEADELEEKLSDKGSISRELSNLAADKLISYLDNENKWTITSELYMKLRKIDLSEEEIKKEFETRIIEPKRKEISSELDQKSKEIVKTPSELDLQIIEVLSSKNYKFFDKSSRETIFTVAEFDIFKIILKHGPITNEDIEEKMRAEGSVSLTLSNLKADDLIQEVDYMYVVPEDLRSKLSKLEDYPFDIDNIRSDNNSLETTSEQIASNASEIETTNKLNKSLGEISIESRERQLPFIKALHAFNLVKDVDLPHSALLSIPEYEIMNLIIKNKNISINEIKEKVDNVSPVMINRTLNKLISENVIVKPEEDIDVYQISESFESKLNSFE